MLVCGILFLFTSPSNSNMFEAHNALDCFTLKYFLSYDIKIVIFPKTVVLINLCRYMEILNLKLKGNNQAFPLFRQIL